ncbi:alpha/beta hydrolase [Mycobacterium sp. CVI_P3]|uniref:Alpha/beta hydrolase n=1 Tax=Mycobacterium pinniadriaticum TaxID=2994102 RepID=A0ABT3SAC8_9MYCO|nr:alpha/beta hydrolase [Mycobacterium pinniadriaticum]MCX2929885.1 alpha/beta hydrolase [Mycobacterium pinniadriaticum]MCX2936466.1 alpha/beta hydrolase [Mycobacterium pinniadriaticum]
MTDDKQRALELWLEMAASMAPTDPDQPATPQQLRDAYDTWAAAHFPPPADLVIEPVDADGVPCLLAQIDGTRPKHTILYFHGGGYMIASAQGYASTAADLARAADAEVQLVDYRLAPEHPFPAALDDALVAYRWLISRRDPSTVVVAGDSAGGGLAAALLLNLRDLGEPMPAAGVCISAWLDMTLASESVTTKAEVDPIMSAAMLQGMADAYLQGAAADSPSASPLRADLRGLPPMLVMTGTWDSLTDDSTRFAEKARGAGVDVALRTFDEMYHCWHIMTPVLEQSRVAISAIGEFVRQHAHPMAPTSR